MAVTDPRGIITRTIGNAGLAAEWLGLATVITVPVGFLCTTLPGTYVAQFPLNYLFNSYPGSLLLWQSAFFRIDPVSLAVVDGLSMTGAGKLAELWARARIKGQASTYERPSDPQ